MALCYNVLIPRPSVTSHKAVCTPAVNYQLLYDGILLINRQLAAGKCAIFPIIVD